MKYSGAYLGKILRIDLATKKVSVESMDEHRIAKLLGGRGIAVKIYYDEIGPEVKPLDPENKLIFMTGPLTGVKLPSTTKVQLATKSPETGMYMCSNSGGEFGPQLKMSGFDGLVIEGAADTWTFLTIQDGWAPTKPSTGSRMLSVTAGLRPCPLGRLASASSGYPT